MQFEHNFLGERDRAEGFYGIMKLQNYRRTIRRSAQARRTDNSIGDESVAFTDKNVVPAMTQADFESLPSAFGPADSPAPDRRWPASDRGARA